MCMQEVARACYNVVSEIDVARVNLLSRNFSQVKMHEKVYDSI